MTIGRTVQVALAELKQKSWQLKDYGVTEKVYWICVSIHLDFTSAVEALFSLAIKEFTKDVSVMREDGIYVSFVADDPVEENFFEKLTSAIDIVVNKITNKNNWKLLSKSDVAVYEHDYYQAEHLLLAVRWHNKKYVDLLSIKTKTKKCILQQVRKIFYTLLSLFLKIYLMRKLLLLKLKMKKLFQSYNDFVLKSFSNTFYLSQINFQLQNELRMVFLII